MLKLYLSQQVFFTELQMVKWEDYPIFFAVDLAPILLAKMQVLSTDFVVSFFFR
jgi:hypothetical protein